jgi:acetyl-CoA carboxylase biotin carboxyl carrier protein
MSAQQDHPHGADIAELREHARQLAASLTGPLRRVGVRSGDVSIEVEWQPVPNGVALLPGSVGGQDAGRALDAPPPDGEPGLADADSDAQLVVSSPMVGTFYRAPSPNAPAFVEVGDSVEPGQTLAVVEAMKLFNPIVAEDAGVVAAVLAENGQPVEFDQPLIRLTVPANAPPELVTGREE